MELPFSKGLGSFVKFVPNFFLARRLDHRRGRTQEMDDDNHDSNCRDEGRENGSADGDNPAADSDFLRRRWGCKTRRLQKGGRSWLLDDGREPAGR
jgi:hypothetical protein